MAGIAIAILRVIVSSFAIALKKLVRRPEL